MNYQKGEFVRMRNCRWDKRLACIVSVRGRAAFPYQVSVVPDKDENFVTLLKVTDNNLNKMEKRDAKSLQSSE